MVSSTQVQLINANSADPAAIDGLIAQLRDRHDASRQRSPPRAKQVKAARNRKFFRTDYSEEQKRLLITIYFGSETDFSKPKFTV